MAQINNGVLHELLAVEGSIEGLRKSLLAETITTFTKKHELFQGFHKTLEMFDDNAVNPAPARKEIDTTVGKKLAYLQKTEQKYYDALLQKEATNQVAKADLIVDGAVIAEGLPSTFLLGMETRLKQLRDVYSVIPTLAPGIKWEVDESLGKGVFRTAHGIETFKTDTKVSAVVLYDATPEHPAQVKELSVTENVGKYVKNEWSGMISPANKSELLGKLDKLIQGCKKARQRANMTPVVKVSVGGAIYKFLNS